MPARPRRRRLLHRVPVAIGLVLGLLTAVAHVEPVAAAAPWPSTWPTYGLATGDAIYDDGSDQNPDYADIWSGAASGPGPLPSVYFVSDGTNVFFRMRIQGDPEVNKGGSFSSNSWLVQIAVGGVHTATVGLDGKPAGVNDVVFVTDPDETAVVTPYAPVVPDGGASGGARALPDGSGAWFVDFQVPISAISSVAPAITPTTPVQLFLGSSTSNSNINKDFMIGSSVDFSGLATIALDGSPAGDTSTTVAITSPTSTSDSTPTITGTGEVGATVEVTVDGQTMTTTVAGDGAWSVTVPVPLADGSFTVTATATDAAGNTAFDTQTLAVDAGTTVAITSASLTNDPTPTIAGTGEPGATVGVTVDGQALTTTVAGDGTWSVDVPVALSDATHTVTATATDAAGNDATAIQPLTVDTATAVSIATSGTTDDPTPTVTGGGEPGSTISLSVGGQVVTATVDGTGSWSATVPVALADGPYTLEATATDLAGNSATAISAIVVDTATSVTITSSDFTNDSTPTISGTGEPGATVEVAVDGQALTTTVAADGSWSVTVPLALADGTHTVSVTATDLSGFSASTVQDLTVDGSTTVAITPPGTTDDPTPVISGTGEPGATIELTVDGQVLTGVVSGTGSWSISVPGALADGTHAVSVTATDLSGNTDTDVDSIIVDTRTTIALTSAALTTDPTPTISGTGEPGAAIEVTVDGQVLTTTVDGTGSWSATVPVGILDGTYAVVAVATDAMGNQATTTQPITIDTATTVAVTSPALTSDSTPTITGTGEPGSTIEVTVDGQVLTTTVDGAGSWSTTVTGTLADTDLNPPYTVSVAATDLAGNVATTTQLLTVDSTTFVTITSPPLTGSATPTVSGLAEPGASITVVVGTETLTTTAAPDGTWSVIATVPLADGSYLVPVTAVVADLSGNTATTSQELTVDTVTTVALTSPTESTDATPTIAGTGEPGATITVSVDGQTLSATVGPTGTWSVAVPVALADGDHTVTVTATDLAGNTATASHTLTVDTSTYVAVTSSPLSSSPTPTISGTSEPGATISVVVGTETLTTTAAPDGTWSVTPTVALADGTHPATITATDTLGNTATTTQNLTVDTTTTVALTSATITNDSTPAVTGTGEPGATITVTVAGQTLTTTVAPDGTWTAVVTTAVPDSDYTVTVTATDLAGNTATTSHTLTVDTTTSASITSPSLTNDPTPTVSGVGEPGATVVVAVDGQSVSTTIAPDGTWTVEVPADVPDGTHTVTATATDLAGNVATSVVDLVVDSTMVAAIDSPSAVSDTTPTLTGTGEVGATITVLLAGTTYSTVVGSDGTWSIDVDELPQGTHTGLLTATDLAGNESTTPIELVVDSVAQLTSTSPALAADSLPTVGGTADPGSSVSVTLAGATYTTTADDDGVWSITVPVALADGTYSVDAVTVDPLGNTTSATWTLVVDTVAELAATAPVVGADRSISGTGEPGATVTVTVGGVTLTTTVDATGAWTVAVPDIVLGGSQNISVELVDAAGNSTTRSFTVVIPTLAPPAPATLAATGASTRDLVGLALGLVVAGTALRTAPGRSRRTRRARA